MGLGSRPYHVEEVSPMELYGLRICPATCSLSKGVHTAVEGLFADIYGRYLAPGCALQRAMLLLK